MKLVKEYFYFINNLIKGYKNHLTYYINIKNFESTKDVSHVMFEGLEPVDLPLLERSRRKSSLHRH